MKKTIRVINIVLFIAIIFMSALLVFRVITLKKEQSNANVEEQSGIATEEQIDSTTEGSTDGYVEEPSDTDPNKFTFNPHVVPQKLYDAYGEAEWTAFFNMVDAIRKGEDTFECSSREVYEWCFSGGVTNNLYPPCVGALERNFVDGYDEERRVGTLTYLIPKEELIKREQEFEAQIMDVVNTYVKKDNTDFEKCLILYNYMVNNYTYDYNEFDIIKRDESNNYERGTFCTYRTFVDKCGVCEDLSSLYNYLLLQCGVEAYQFNSGSLDHAWSYVIVGGQGYHVDPTWAICDYDGNITLQYFLMPEYVRAYDCPKGDIYPPLYYYDYHNNVEFPADDNSYEPLRSGNFVNMDTERKVVQYSNVDGVFEFQYFN